MKEKLTDLPRVELDPGRSLYVRLSRNRVWKTLEPRQGVLVDIDDAGEAVAVEVYLPLISEEGIGQPKDG